MRVKQFGGGLKGAEVYTGIFQKAEQLGEWVPSYFLFRGRRNGAELELPLEK